MSKTIAFDQDVRTALMRGVRKLSRAVKGTLGPKGRLAIVDRSFGAPRITKDGVSVAEEIELADPFENLGAQLVREAAAKTGDAAGDGTTTATLLAEAIFGEGLKSVAAGRSPIALSRGIQAAGEKVAAALVAMGRPLEGNADIARIATLAANGNSEIGEMIANAYAEVGSDGVITVEEGKSASTSVSFVSGMQFDRGFISPHFVTDQDRLEAALDNPYILIYQHKITTIKPLLPILEAIAKVKGGLVIIAEDIEGEALATLVVNCIKAIVPCLAIKAPGYGERRKALLDDLAALTGTQRFGDDIGSKLETLGLDDLGRAKRILATKDNTTLTEGSGEAQAVVARCDTIRRELDNSDSDYDREKLRERLARLRGGVAKISVGAATETEMKEIKDRVDDALQATRAAIEEGLVAGGGVALLRSAKAVDEMRLEGDEAVGAKVLRSALRAPLRQLLDNAGVRTAVVLRQVEQGEGPFGFDVTTEVYGDLMAAGIVDPVKVTRSALQNAVSVASILLTADCAICSDKDSAGSDAAGMGGMGGMGGMPGMGGMGGMGGMPGMGGMGGMGGMPGMGGMGF